jgi:hypothetical protein
MKNFTQKTAILLCALAIKFISISQILPDTLIKEGFESGIFPPTGWTNSSTSTYAWFPYSGTGVSIPEYYSHSGSDCAASSSWGLTPNAYLITPKLLISDTTYSLKFWISGGDTDFFSEHYSILISQTGTNYNDFTPIFSETLTDGNTNSSAYKLRTCSLAAYKGKNIYIAFKHHDCFDQYYLKLDDILVSGTKNYTGFNDLNEESKIKVYPNPTSDKIEISNVMNPEVEIVNNIGELVLKANSNSIDLSHLNEGIYTIKIQNEHSMITKKISVIKNN